MQKPLVLRPSELPKIERGAGVRSTVLVTHREGAKQLTMGISNIGPGITIPLHYHNCEESIVIQEGEAIAEIDGIRHPVKAGDVTFIPPDVPHRFENPGPGPLQFMWIYGSVDITRTIVATGETIPHLSERDQAIFQSA